MNELTITVYGQPAPQGSKRAFRNQYTGRIQQTESSQAVKPWRQDVKTAAIKARSTIINWLPIDEPIVAEMIFTFVRPKSHYRTGRNAHLIRNGAPLRPEGAPDLSKLCRSTEDALTAAGIWRDDARVVEYQRLAKVYAGEDPDALDTPGAVIRIRPYEPDDQPAPKPATERLWVDGHGDLQVQNIIPASAQEVLL